MYQIKQYTRDQAKRLNVTVRASTNKNKKIDVFKDKKKISSIGFKGYSDYPTYMQTKGKKFADERRRLYKIRHEKTRHVKDSPSYYADQLLW